MYINEGTFNRLKETAANAIAERDQLKAGKAATMLAGGE